MRKALHILLTILPLILLGTGTAIGAQPSTTLPIGVTVDVPESQEASPGQFVTYIFNLTNTENHPLTLTISAKSEHGWSILGPEQATDITIDPHSSAAIPMTLAIPTNALGNQTERLMLEITHNAKKWRFYVDTRISAIHKLVVDSRSRHESEPEQAADYPVTILNQGSLPEHIQLSVVSENGWLVRVEPDNLALQPGEKGLVHVYHTPPALAQVGTADKAVLTVKSLESNEKVNLTLLTQVIEESTPKPYESRIPLRSTWLWEFTSPTQYVDDPELRWLYNVSGSLQPNYNFDFYMNGNYNTEELIAPDAIHLTLNTPKTRVNVGRVDSAWYGVLPTPTQTTLLSLEHEFSNRWHVQFLTGTKRDEDNFFNDQVRWTAWSAWDPGSPWTFRLLLPKDSSEDTDYLGEVDYALKFGSARNSWSLRARIGGGESNSDGFKHAQDFYISGYGDKWNFRGEYSAKDAFYDENDERHINVNGVYRFTPNFSWELGYYRWRENHWTDPNDLFLSSESIWTRFNLWRNLALTLSSVREDQGSDAYRQPKVEVRYYYQVFPITYNFTVQWMQPNYEIGPDETKWAFDGQYKYSWSDLHYIDNRIHYYRAQAINDMDESWNFAYHLNYSRPINNAWSFIASTDWEHYRDKGSAYETTSTTVKGEFAYKPAPDTQWRFSLYDVISTTDTTDDSTLTLYLFYQRQFLSFIRSPWAGVEGIVYEDLNGNGRLDREDPLLEGVSLLLDGNKTAKTDNRGRWAYLMLPAGAHHLSINLDGLPYYTAAHQFDLTLKRGLTERIYIPVHRKNFLRGLVFVDANRNLTFDHDEKQLDGVRVTLVQNGMKTAETLTGGDGSYFFNDIIPGTYQLQLDVTTIPEGVAVELPLDDLTVTISQTDAGQEINWALAPKEKEIEFTFDTTGSGELEPLPAAPEH
jgi:hypothetical protein